jgi:hypothetical protein
MPDHPSKFKPTLGLLDATMIVAGSMIGSGIFICSKTSDRAPSLSISMRLRAQLQFPTRTPRGTAARDGAHPSNCNEGRIVTHMQRQQNESAGADHIEPSSRQSHCIPGF